MANTNLSTKKGFITCSIVRLSRLIVCGTVRYPKWRTQRHAQHRHGNGATDDLFQGGRPAPCIGKVQQVVQSRRTRLMRSVIPIPHRDYTPSPVGSLSRLPPRITTLTTVCPSTEYRRSAFFGALLIKSDTHYKVRRDRL